MKPTLRISTPASTNGTSNVSHAPSRVTPTPSRSTSAPPTGPLAGLKGIAKSRVPERSQTISPNGNRLGAQNATPRAAEAPGRLETDPYHFPKSPRTTAGRLFKTANADPNSKVTDGLGAKSSSHPGVSFAQGGGFNVTTENRRKPTQQEIKDDYAQKRERYETAMKANSNPKSSRQSPKPLDGTKEKTFFKGQMEYHPPGGIHSNYPGKVNYGNGGSYLRVRQEVPQGGEQRFGRNGPFDARKTFDGQKLGGKPQPVSNPATPPNVTDSPPPSPATASTIMQSMYKDPPRAMQELASGKPYKDVAAALK
jgi:hypothetical protein